VLTLTDTAVKAIRALASQDGMPDDTGVRITPQEDENGSGPGFALALVAGPDFGDKVIEADSARVYLPPVADQLLSDQTLDAKVTGENRVEFRLAPSADEAG
jgi:iron-sulfur cluster assembly protein